jgi:hypothetical protein
VALRQPLSISDLALGAWPANVPASRLDPLDRLAAAGGPFAPYAAVLRATLWFRMSLGRPLSPADVPALQDTRDRVVRAQPHLASPAREAARDFAQDLEDTATFASVAGR